MSTYDDLIDAAAREWNGMRADAIAALVAERDAALDRVVDLCIKYNVLFAERDLLARWKSTHAPRIEALQGLLGASQIEAGIGAEAMATLLSERKANSILTDELDALRAERDATVREARTLRNQCVLLDEKLDAAVADAERWRYFVTHCEWIRHWPQDAERDEPYSYMLLRLPYGADQSCVGTRTAAIDAARQPQERKT